MTMSPNTPLEYSTLGSDPDLGELVEMFVDEMPNRVATLKQHGGNTDWEELRRSAHQIKGAAGSYGFGQVTPFAAKLEESCAEVRNEEAILQNLDALVSLCERLRAGSPE